MSSRQERPSLARFGPHAMSDLSPFLGEQRTTFARCELFRFGPNSDMAAYPNSNQRALMIIPKAS